jgi:hypothetical protein
MDDRFKIETYVAPRRDDSHRAPHRCWFNNSNRCSCGKHREPAFATGIVVTGTDKERLTIEL